MIQIDMPMPDNCVECRFNVSEFGYCNAMPVEFVGQVSDCEEDGRPEWCPLKAQEPRVMDFDDVVGGDECWLEAINGACGYADCYACTGTGEVQVFRCNFDNPQYIMASDYLKTWRCWTSRPTDEQREAVKWE